LNELTHPYDSVTLHATCAVHNLGDPMRKLMLVAAAVLVTIPFMGHAALADTCSGAASSFATINGGAAPADSSCTVGGLTYSNITINTVGAISGLSFSPVITPTEVGLNLTFADGSTSGADVDWTYTVTSSGSPINDATATVVGGASGGGVVGLDETLETLSLQQIATINCSGTTGCSGSATFSPISSIFADKDQYDIANGGTAESSSIINTFSFATPLPAALPLFASGLAVFGFWTRRRKSSRSVLSATAA
jgi:hypothetical protein